VENQEKKRPEIRGKLLGGLDRKKMEVVIGVIIILAMVLLYVSTFSSGGEKRETPSAESPSQETAVYNYLDEEERLKSILARINGVGEVQVMITYAGGSELVPAYNSDSSVQSSEEINTSGTTRTTRNESESKKPVTQQDGTVLLSEKRPEVVGVIIVAQGAQNVEVRMALIKAAQTALDVPLNKVEVFEMN
jgi:stage III sporulation protein AG